MPEYDDIIVDDMTPILTALEDGTIQKVEED